MLDLVERLERGADVRWLQWALIASAAEADAREVRMKQQMETGPMSGPAPTGRLH